LDCKKGNRSKKIQQKEEWSERESKRDVGELK
jgi:hypothetical protein